MLNFDYNVRLACLLSPFIPLVFSVRVLTMITAVTID
jgi:hypothetical protein